jgi:hypothetical protein
MNRALATIGQVAAATATFAAGTLLGGWVSLPVLAFVAIAITDRQRGPQPILLGLAGGLAWVAILGWRAWTSPVGELAHRLAGLFGQAGWVLPAMTPVFALLLVWGTATLSAAVFRREKPGRIIRPGSAWHS